MSSRLLPFLALLCTIASAVTPPGCQLAAPSQVTLSSVRTAYTTVSGFTFGIAYASAWQGDYAFVTITDHLGVFNTSTFPPTLLHEFEIPFVAANVQLSSNGKRLYISGDYGAVIVDTARAIADGTSCAIVGTLNGTTETQHPGHSAFQVTVPADEEYAFVTQEDGDTAAEYGNIDVFKLHPPSSNGSITGTPLGFVSLAQLVTGTSLAPGGQILYTTSELARNSSTVGQLHILDVPKLESDPPSALLGNVSAGCSPVRTLSSADGSVVWVTARESNHLLAFDTSKLLSDPDTALIASVQVGTSPVALSFVKNETRILTADSNRFKYGNVTGISVVDVQAALAGKGDAAVLGRVPTGAFPRTIEVSRDGRTALVADYGSDMVQAIDVMTLP